MKRSGPLVLLTLALTACGASPDAAEGSNYDAIDGNWTLTDRLSAQSLTPDGVNTLYYEQALIATSAWGPIEVDRSNGERGMGDGKTLTLNGVKHTKGYGVHAPSELKYSLAGTDNAKCVRFKAQIGIDDEVGKKGSAVFQIWGDSGKLFDSGVMTGASATKPVSVDLRGQSTFRMVVTDAGDGKSFDHADWINPTITCVPDITASVPEFTGLLQDAHGTLPLTLTNRSALFKGDLTYRVSAYQDEDAFENPRFNLKTPGIRLNGAGVTTQSLNIYAPPLIPVEYSNVFNPPTLPDTFVIFAYGEEVTRVPMGVYGRAQEIDITFPDQPRDIRVGETITVQAKITVSPGGETTGPSLSISGDPDARFEPELYQVEGGGSVPKEGGMVPVRITLLRAPDPSESNEFTVYLSRSIDNFSTSSLGYPFSIRLRYVP